MHIRCVKDLETALHNYKSISVDAPEQASWSVAENDRFEPALVECKKLVAEIGTMMSVQVIIIEGSMISSNPYFSTTLTSNPCCALSLSSSAAATSALSVCFASLSL
ncbi:hypothetical protein HN51_027239, partial [Arachis hypogaea]